MKLLHYLRRATAEPSRLLPSGGQSPKSWPVRLSDERGGHVQCQDRVRTQSPSGRRARRTGGVCKPRGDAVYRANRPGFHGQPHRGPLARKHWPSSRLTDPSGPISKSTSDELSWPRHEILPVVSLTCPMTVTSDTPSESLSDFLPPPRYFCYDNSELLDAGGV
jgi:hypothetical protein